MFNEFHRVPAERTEQVKEGQRGDVKKSAKYINKNCRGLTAEVQTSSNHKTFR